MNVRDLSRRVDELSAKLPDEPEERIGRFDISTFTEQEKVLLSKVDELHQKYGVGYNPEMTEEDIRLIFKASDMLLDYAVGTFKEALVGCVGTGSDVETWYFNLFFYNFMMDLIDCFSWLRTWAPEKRKGFVEDLQNSGGVEEFFVFLMDGDQSVISSERAQKPMLRGCDGNEHYDREY